MSFRRAMLILIIGFFAFTGWQFALHSHDVSPKSESPNAAYVVQQAGGSFLMLDSLHGKTWMLRRRDASNAVWLPIPKIDTESEASPLWSKTTTFNLESPQTKEQSKPFSTLLIERGYVRIPIEKLRIGYYRVPVRINGNKLYLILDSGQPLTHLDLERTKHLKLKWAPVDNGGKKEAKSAESTTDSLSTIETLEIGGIEIRQTLVGGHDLSDVNKIVKAYLDPLVDGELGSDVLIKYGAIIDFSVPEFYLRPRSMK